MSQPSKNRPSPDRPSETRPPGNETPSAFRRPIFWVVVSILAVIIGVAIVLAVGEANAPGSDPASGLRAPAAGPLATTVVAPDRQPDAWLT